MKPIVLVRRLGMARVWLCAGMCIPIIATTPSLGLAHQGLHEAIAALTARIEKAPGDAKLYLDRGELHRLHADWDAAMADCERSARLDKNLLEVDYCRGRLLLDAGWLQSAELVLSRFIEQRPADAPAHEALAQVLSRRGEHFKAAAEFSEAIQLSPHPPPEWFIARANALSATSGDHVADAIHSLDEGIQRLGPIVTLQNAAIELELRRSHFDDALARLQTVANQAERKEQWSVRRGDILRRAGRPADACQAYREALHAISQLAPARRNTEAVAALAKHAEAGLKELASGVASQPSGIQGVRK